MATYLEKSKKAQWCYQALAPVYQSWNFGEDQSISFWETGVIKSTIKKYRKKIKKKISAKYVARLASLPSGINTKALLWQRDSRPACQYRKKLQSMNDLDIHPRSSQLLLTSCLWTIVSTSLSRTDSRHYHFWSERDCLWPWELLHIWQRSLNYKPYALSNLCVNIHS